MPENQTNDETAFTAEAVTAETVAVEFTEAVAPAAEPAATEAEAPAKVEEAPAAKVEEAPAAKTEDAPAKAEEAEEEEGVKFADLGIDGRVLAALMDVGYEKPSPIQAATIPLLLEGRDVVGLAQTGTGKTAAFAVPALSRLAELHDLNGPSRKTQALVLAPTRELALQVAEAFTSYAKHIDDFTVLPVYGGSAYGPQLAGLRRGAQVVVGTPGRVIDHISKGSLDLSELQYLVLDEADEMLRMGFAEDVEQIFQQTPSDRQVALFSATMPSQIRRMSKQYLNNPAEISVKSKTTTGANTRQRYLQVMGPHKLDALTRILEVEEFDGVIAFVRTKMATEDLADKLKARGFQAAAINGDIPQQQRERTVEALKEGRIDILVATDVAARGLDVERISHVVNYDIPHDTESYVHRIGRTGRAGRSGDAILFMTPREKYLLRSIEKATRQPVEQMHLPTAETVNTLRLGKFAERITETLESEDVAAFRDLISSYEEEHNVPASEIAAALAVMAQGGQPLLVKELAAAPDFQKRERSKDGFGSRGPTRTLTEGNATYRIAVGRRQRVMPGSIVGAIANEGGISSANIGGIDIRADHSLVELPADLSADQLKALSRTRIGGELIHLELDNGRKPSGDGERGGYQGNRGGGDRGGYQGNRGGGERGGYSGGGDRGGYSGGGAGGGDRGGNFKGNGGFKKEFRKTDGERSSADRGGRSFSDRNERSVGTDAARKPRTEGGFKPRNKW
ncbi:DEAD/DEAH box helicase [Pseudarthrobacter cellobiosi]|uniref:DEAD/DEAH box helicase n=1 Tax=Pseudarthrobacter cellobiosi TaxID=2953654 RepID=UPI00208DFEA9|nr:MULTISPECIES: DEAD/DEAH box helicase [unclassified Pseudarthrobacter]MCO4256886.1 DEAD/DEAH box helicase [Pseudarthrobacter sp. HLT1-5]MCO4276397.1 DEAD/DEAH box helicase [Pseudarthrobacter sp. HLT3-5]